MSNVLTKTFLPFLRFFGGLGTRRKGGDDIFQTIYIFSCHAFTSITKTPDGSFVTPATIFLQNSENIGRRKFRCQKFSRQKFCCMKFGRFS